MPTRDQIKIRVIEKLQAVTDEDQLAADEGSDLQLDLGMSAPLKKGMAKPYSNISQDYAGGRAITLTDAGNCTTVKDVIELVFKRATGK